MRAEYFFNSHFYFYRDWDIRLVNVLRREELLLLVRNISLNDYFHILSGRRCRNLNFNSIRLFSIQTKCCLHLHKPIQLSHTAPLECLQRDFPFTVLATDYEGHWLGFASQPVWAWYAKRIYRWKV